MAAPFCIETPMMRMSGFSALAAIAMPLMRPPPDSGTTMAARSGRSSSSSSAMVPCPAITCGMVEWRDVGQALALGQAVDLLLGLVLAVADPPDLGAQQLDVRAL